MLAGLCACALLGSCGYLDGDAYPDDSPVLAEVGDQVLHLSQVADLVPPGASVGDSLAVLQRYADAWVREAALLERAEEAHGDDPEVARLTREYRASLVRDRYEATLADARVDTAVSAADYAAYYRQVSTSMRAGVPLLRATLIKLPEGAPDRGAFERAWYGGDDTSAFAREYVRDHAALALTDPARWRTADELAALLPGGKLGSTRAGTRVVNAEGRVYYLRIHESIDAGQPVPLAYVRPRLRRGILERRRADFLAAERDRLYREARGRDAIKTYIGNDDS